MSEFNPLVQRVDALLKRHHEQVEETRSEPSVGAHSQAPEELHSEARAETHAEPSAETWAPPAAEPEDDIPVLTDVVEPVNLPAPALGLQDHALAEQIGNAVLERVLTELDQTLEQRLGRTISDLLDQAVQGVRADLSSGVREMVREALAKAIAREIAERVRPA